MTVKEIIKRHGELENTLNGTAASFREAVLRLAGEIDRMDNMDVDTFKIRNLAIAVKELCDTYIDARDALVDFANQETGIEY